MSRPVAVVTGARQGIGKATAIALAGAGMRVVVTTRSLTDDGGSGRTIGQTVEAIERAGGEGYAVAMDLTDRSSIDRALAEVRSNVGGIDLLVNNALAQPAGQALMR